MPMYDLKGEWFETIVKRSAPIHFPIWRLILKGWTDNLQCRGTGDQEECQHGASRACVDYAQRRWLSPCFVVHTSLHFHIGVAAPIVGTTSLQNLQDLVGARNLLVSLVVANQGMISRLHPCQDDSRGNEILGRTLRTPRDHRALLARPISISCDNKLPENKGLIILRSLYFQVIAAFMILLWIIISISLAAFLSWCCTYILDRHSFMLLYLKVISIRTCLHMITRPCSGLLWLVS